MLLIEFLRRLFGTSCHRISTKDFLLRVGNDRNAVLFDLRKQADFDKGTLAGAIHLSLSDRNFSEVVSGLDKSRVYYVFGYGALSSGLAARRFVAANLVVFSLDGTYSRLKFNA